MEKYTITSEELAQRLGIPRSAILRHRAGVISHQLLKGLPEPIMTRPKLVWVLKDIEAWIESIRTFRAPAEQPQPARRGRGRSRKH